MLNLFTIEIDSLQLDFKFYTTVIHQARAIIAA